MPRKASPSARKPEAVLEPASGFDPLVCPFSGRAVEIAVVGQGLACFYQARSPYGWSSRLFEDRQDLLDWLKLRDGEAKAPPEGRVESVRHPGLVSEAEEDPRHGLSAAPPEEGE